MRCKTGHTLDAFSYTEQDKRKKIIMWSFWKQEKAGRLKNALIPTKLYSNGLKLDQNENNKTEHHHHHTFYRSGPYYAYWCPSTSTHITEYLPYECNLARISLQFIFKYKNIILGT